MRAETPRHRARRVLWFRALSLVFLVLMAVGLTTSPFGGTVAGGANRKKSSWGCTAKPRRIDHGNTTTFQLTVPNDRLLNDSKPVGPPTGDLVLTKIDKRTWSARSSRVHKADTADETAVFELETTNANAPEPDPGPKFKNVTCKVKVVHEHNSACKPDDAFARVIKHDETLEITVEFGAPKWTWTVVADQPHRLALNPPSGDQLQPKFTVTPIKDDHEVETRVLTITVTLPKDDRHDEKRRIPFTCGVDIHHDSGAQPVPQPDPGPGPGPQPDPRP